jgi:Rod binding domain-containing protein
MAAAGLPPLDSALLPVDVRKAGPKAEQTYETALSFESVLTEQLTQSLTSTLTGSSTGSDGSDNDGSDGGSTDAATELTTQMLPDALTQSLTAAGGLGLARQLYTALGGARGDGGSQ